MLLRIFFNFQLLYQLSPYQIKKLLKETLLEDPNRSVFGNKRILIYDFIADQHCIRDS